VGNREGWRPSGMLFVSNYAFTSGHPPSLSGRNASSIGVVAKTFATSHCCLLSEGFFASKR